MKPTLQDDYLAQRAQSSKVSKFHATRKGAAWREERCKYLFKRYCELGTLEAVAVEANLTRERVRQILTEGTNTGWCDYHGPFTHDAILMERVGDAKALLEHYDWNVRCAAESVGIGERMFERLFANAIRSRPSLAELSEVQCVQRYRAIAKIVGHDPNTTELQGKGRNGPHPAWTSAWRALSARIERSADGFAVFCDKHGFNPPRCQGLQDPATRAKAFATRVEHGFKCSPEAAAEHSQRLVDRWRWHRAYCTEAMNTPGHRCAQSVNGVLAHA